MEPRNIKIELLDQKGQVDLLEKKFVSYISQNKDFKLVLKNQVENHYEIAFANEKTPIRLYLLYGITFTVACCSLLYEMILAQSLATTTGQTILSYNITIGVYIFSMGLGSFLSEKLLKNKERNVLTFTKLEMTLTLIGFFTPVLIVSVDAFFHYLNLINILSYHHFVTKILISSFNYFLITVIGVLTGIELPLLAKMADTNDDQGENLKILSIDYIGSFVGALIFPFLLIPYLNLFSISSLTSFFNLIAAIITLFLFKNEIAKKDFNFWGIILFILLGFFLLYFVFLREDFIYFITNFIYFLGI